MPSNKEQLDNRKGSIAKANNFFFIRLIPTKHKLLYNEYL